MKILNRIMFAVLLGAFFIGSCTPGDTRLHGGTSAQTHAPIIPMFAASSFWYQTIPADATLNANSANYTAEFLSQLTNGPVGANFGWYTSPIFNVTASTPLLSVVPFDCFSLGFYPPLLDSMWANMPFPTYAAPSDGTDEEMTIYDQTTDKLYEFWQLQSTGPGAWRACRGDRIDNVSTVDGRVPNGGIYGAAATGLPFAPGLVTAEELKAGHIDHVIGLALGRAEDYGTWSWPAQRSDGYNPDHIPNFIPEGLRVRLDPTVNVDALNIHPIAKIIAKAAQTYGFVIWDKTGSTPSVRFLNLTSYTAIGLPEPYTPMLNGTPDYQVFDGFPWDRLQWMPMNYGEPSP